MMLNCKAFVNKLLCFYNIVCNTCKVRISLFNQFKLKNMLLLYTSVIVIKNRWRSDLELLNKTPSLTLFYTLTTSVPSMI